MVLIKNVKVYFALFCFCAALYVNASYAKHAFIIANETPYLKIVNTAMPEVTAIGPSDFVVFQGSVAVLDSEKHAITFFNKSGTFIKRIELPSGFYQRLIRDRDNTLFAFADKDLSTLIVKINSHGLEQKELIINMNHMISHALIDDYGLSFESSSAFNLNTLNKSQLCPSCILKEIQEGVHDLKQQRIGRDCFSCNPQETKGATINGLSYRIKYKNDRGEKPSLFIGKKEIKLNQKYKNAGTHIEQVDGDGTAWVAESVFLDKQTVVTYILKIAASGELQAIFRLPKIPANDYVAHPIAISDQGEVWVMSGHSKNLAFDVLEALPQEQQHKFLEPYQKLPLKTPDTFPNNAMMAPQSKVSLPSLSAVSCQSRTDMFFRGIQYYWHYQCYSSETIENDPSCPGRRIPPYLIGNQSKCLFSVSYSWGGFDSVESFGEKVERMKAGNINTAHFPLPSCTTGVDCSGFVSNVWGLKTKWSTNQIFEKTETISIDGMNTGDVFVKPNNHVMLYIVRNNDVISSYESIVRPGKVIVSEHEAGWFVQHGYTPKIAFNVCLE